MPEHIYSKEDLVNRFDNILNVTLEKIDNKGFFERIRAYSLQKGVAGSLIEQCVLEYDPDSKQEPDLIVIDEGKRIKTELKTTGMVVKERPTNHFEAKEPMSITAVGVYDIANQDFEHSHFWKKLEHMLIVYYHYLSDKPVEAYDYRLFPVKGYEFHEFDEIEIKGLKQDWESVHSFIKGIVEKHSGEKDNEWKEAVKQEYIDTHGQLRRLLSYIDLAPKFPPRFRLKKTVVSAIISKHFGQSLEQLPGKYASISDIDKKCGELTKLYQGKRIEDLAKQYGMSVVSESGSSRKGIAEAIVVAMFGGESKKLNQIELFHKFGIVGKTIAMTVSGGRTEDMKLFHINFDDIIKTEITDEENGEIRQFEFEDSEFYSYFVNNELLCIIFQEAELESVDDKGKEYSLISNEFKGFKRLNFTDDFIYNIVRKLWEDTRKKVLNKTLIDVVNVSSNGQPIVNNSGDISSAPNFLKSKENDVFIRGSGADSSLKNKTECVNGIKMLPQYVWIKGTTVIQELEKIEYL